MYAAQCPTFHAQDASKKRNCSEMNRQWSSGIGNTRTYARRSGEPAPAICAVFNPIQVRGVAAEVIAAGTPEGRDELAETRRQSAVAGVWEGNTSEDLGEWVVSARQSLTISPPAMTILLANEDSVE